MATDTPGKGILFKGSATSTAAVTVPFSVDQYSNVSFQIKTDGTAAVNYTVQATNVPAQPADFGPPYRSDTATSIDWSTISTGSTSTGASGASSIVTLNVCPYRSMRLIVTATSSTVTTIYGFGTGSSS